SSVRHLLRRRAVHHGLDPRPEGILGGGAGRHRQHPRGNARRPAARRGGSARRRLHRRYHRSLPLRRLCRDAGGLQGRRQLRAGGVELPGCVQLPGADPGARLPAAGTARRTGRRSRLKHPWAVRISVVLIAVTLAILPFALAQVGTAWVRITNYAVLYILLALGLNIVVGFAGLLDLGYIAFYAVGAYTYALLASPQFGLHLPFWIILPIGALVAAFFGVILGAPTLKLRGDYLAIVTLGFGEIIRVFLNNLSRPVNITN